MTPMKFVCVKCRQPTDKIVNGHCPECWAAGPAIELKAWLERRGFDFTDKK